MPARRSRTIPGTWERTEIPASASAPLWSSAQPGRGKCGNAHQGGLSGVVLRPCPRESGRTRAASLAGTSTMAMPSADKRVGSGAPSPAAPSIAQLACGQRLAKAPQLPVTRRTDRHPQRGQRLQRRIHRRRSPGRLRRIDRDDHPPGALPSVRDTQPPQRALDTTSIMRRGGHTNFGSTGLSSHSTGSGDRDAGRRTVSPTGDTGEPSNPDHRLEDHGCRPRSPTGDPTS
jgi:hypothetical protein